MTPHITTNTGVLAGGHKSQFQRPKTRTKTRAGTRTRTRFDHNFPASAWRGVVVLVVLVPPTTIPIWNDLLQRQGSTNQKPG